MKRTFKYALTAVLGAAIFVPAVAQDAGQFPDVPSTHWAYKELLTMKNEGLLVGYPDGLFRGGRPASRYELAVAVHATYAHLKGITDGLKSQIDDILRRLDNTATKADLDSLREQLSALQTEVGRIKSEDIARLNRLADEFRAELTRLGADVNAMKRDLAALNDRVTGVEKRLPVFDFSGDLNLVVLGGYGSSDRYGITVDGRPTGVGRGDYDDVVVGATRDLTVGHEFGLTLTSNPDAVKGVQFRTTLVFGNITTNGETFFGNQNNIFDGERFGEGDAVQYFQEFLVSFDTSVAGLGFNAQIGRVGYKVSPYIFQRLDNTPYFSNDRWDNGHWAFDGAILGFNFGKAKLDLFGGRTGSLEDTDSNQFQRMSAGAVGSPFIPGTFDRPRGETGGILDIDQFLGASVSLPLSSAGNLRLSYLWLDSNDVINSGSSVAGIDANRVEVYGGDLKFNFSGIGVEAGYAKSDLKYNSSSRVDEDNAAWFVKAGLNRDRWGLNVGYRQVDPQFAAPGDWGRIGIWYNPTDIKGFHADAHYDLTQSLRLRASGEFYTGTGTAVNQFLGASSPSVGLSTDDKLNRFTLGLEYKLATNYSLALGLEEVQWDLADRSGFTGGKPRERWYNIGFGFDLSDKAKLSFLWQISDYDSKGVEGFSPFGSSSGPNATRATGGLITTQLTVKF